MILYLIVVLALVGADPAPVKPECETKYSCYKPMGCQAAVTQASNVLVPTEAESSVDSNCFVFLNIHPHSTYFYRIVMESVESTDRIDIMQIYDSASERKPRFSCVRENGEMKALYKDQKQLILISSSTTGKFTCEFEIDERLLDQKQVTEDAQHVQFQLNNIQVVVKSTNTETKTAPSTITANLFCMPSDILFSQDKFQEDKYYKKATYDMGNVICNDASFSFEFRQEESGDQEGNFEKAIKVECERSDDRKGVYKLLNGTNNWIYMKEEVDVRCVADTEYFCDYDLKYAEGKQKLDRTKPDITLNQKGKIECPSTHEWFVMKGRTPVKNPSIKCLNHHGKMKWTYNGIILSSTGPEVYCEDKLECSKIAASNLGDSFLDENFLPKCHPEEQLRVREGSGTAVNVLDVTCDTKTGQYKYRTVEDNATKPLTSATAFSCFFDDPVKNVNKERVQDIGKAIGIAVGSSFVLSLCISLVVFLVTVGMAEARKRKVAKRKMAKMEEIKIENADSKDNQENHYAVKKRKAAKSTIHWNVLPDMIAVFKRAMERLSAEAMQLNGKRTGIKTFEKFKFEKNEVMKRMDSDLKVSNNNG